MNNKGFIATSIMYSFFIVFALMCLSILGSYSHYRKLNVNLNRTIKNELTDLYDNDVSDGVNRVYLYNEGTINTEFGGMKTIALPDNDDLFLDSGVQPTVTYNANSVKLKMVSNDNISNGGAWIAFNKIDLTDYNSLVVEVESSNSTINDSGGKTLVYMIIRKSTSGYMVDSNQVTMKSVSGYATGDSTPLPYVHNDSANTYSLNIRSVSGENVVGIFICASKSTVDVTIKNLWLE